MTQTRVLRCGNLTVALTLVTAGCLLLARNFGRPVWEVVSWWPLVPLAAGVETLVKCAIARRRAAPARLDGLVVPLCAAVILFGLTATPVRHLAQGFPFSTTYSLPRVFTLGQAAFKAERTFTITVPDEVGVGDRVTFSNQFGNVKVVGMPGTSVITVKAQVTARERTQAAADRLAADVTLGARKTGKTVELVAAGLPARDLGTEGGRQGEGSGSNRPGVALDVEITAPPEVAVAMQSQFGAIRVEGMRADVRVETNFGEVRVSDVTGNVDAHSNFGGVEVIGVRGEVTGRTEFGGVTCVHEGAVAGSCRLSTKFGAVKLELRGGAEGSNYTLAARSGRGRITTSLPMSVTTQGGQTSGGMKSGTGQFTIDLQTEFGEILITTR